MGAKSPCLYGDEMTGADFSCKIAPLRKECGVLQGTASEAVLVALLAAQAKAMAGRPEEHRERLVCYSSDQVERPSVCR